MLRAANSSAVLNATQPLTPTETDQYTVNMTKTKATMPLKAWIDALNIKEPGLTTPEMTKRAIAAGYKPGPKTISQIRYVLGIRDKANQKPANKPAAAPQKPSAKQAAPTTNTELEDYLRRLVARIGTLRARAILDEMDGGAS